MSDYRNMTLKEGSKYAGFYWYMAVELVLLIVAIIAIANGDIATGFIVFILIEVREINYTLKDKSKD